MAAVGALFFGTLLASFWHPFGTLLQFVRQVRWSLLSFSKLDIRKDAYTRPRGTQHALIASRSVAEASAVAGLHFAHLDTYIYIYIYVSKCAKCSPATALASATDLDAINAC